MTKDFVGQKIFRFDETFYQTHGSLGGSSLYVFGLQGVPCKSFVVITGFYLEFKWEIGPVRVL